MDIMRLFWCKPFAVLGRANGARRSEMPAGRVFQAPAALPLSCRAQLEALGSRQNVPAGAARFNENDKIK